MLLQTNSYIVPKDKRAQHERLMRRFRQALQRIGCEHFEVYEQVGPSWGAVRNGGRFVQILRFRDRQHQLAVQAAEKSDPAAQEIIREFCALLEMPHQQEKGLFAIGYYNGLISSDPMAIWKVTGEAPDGTSPEAAQEFSTLPADPPSDNPES
jgi:hypothetical protein